MPQHVDRGLGLFQDDVTDKWFVLAIVGLHFDEEHLVRPDWMLSDGGNGVKPSGIP